MENPSKADIAQVFKKLRASAPNKVCFDCGCKNPTWASTTYGVYICIDCSGIHRSLGVHLTFVKSTQLDHNWSWQQVRQMQLGGNANAGAFFRSHHCDTTDTQLKYKSRAAQLYRDKLHGEAAKAMRIHGPKLFIDAPQSSAQEDESAEAKDDQDDFFEQSIEASTSVQQSLPQSVKLAPTIAKPNGNDVPEGAPNVEAALSTSPTVVANIQAARKPTIGQRKTQANKGKLGSKLGAKKAGGLGAQKVKKDFSEIEREAEMADLGRIKATEEAKETFKATEEDEAKQAASMRLAYQDLSLEQKKTEEKMQKVDPKKAKQVERLGMGVTKKGGFSHSMITEIATIDQEEVGGRSASNRVDEFSSRSKSKFDDDFEFIGGSGLSSDNAWKSSNNNRIESSWEKEFEVMKSTSKISSSQPKDNWSNDFDQDQGPKRSSGFDSRPKRPETLSTSSASFDAKKYGSAKAISSDMLFGQDQNSGQDANLSRFQGSSSISSAEYFNRQETTYAAGRGMQTPDMDDVKESVRQGVTKVAGRLSNLASGAMSQLQDKYGY